jgi:hypothetical protein
MESTNNRNCVQGPCVLMIFQNASFETSHRVYVLFPAGMAWQWRDDGGWRSYSENVGDSLDDILAEGDKWQSLQVGRQTYDIDLVRMIQVNRQV